MPSETPASTEPAEEALAPLIVVAEDDHITREYVGGLLRGHGYRVELHESASGAVQRAAQGDASLMLLDVLMPGMTGLEACRLIKAMDAETFLPVVLVTGRSDADSRVEGLRIGADDYVCKPFDERELLARLSGLLRIKKMHDEIRAAKERLEALAITDELTGLYNFRYLHTRLHEEFKRAERHRDPLGCAMIDVDRFKEVNDTHGHDVGDMVLKTVAARVTEAVREIDVVTRYGGDELLLVLPSTHFSGAVTVAERIWSSIRAEPMPIGEGRTLDLTVSIGVALYPSRDVSSKKELLRAADQALYQAKGDGRDRICVFQHQGYIYRPGA